MADILVSALLQTVLGNFNSISIQEIGLSWGSEDELDSLKSTFETIQLLLQDAEMKQRKSLTLQNWLRKLKNAAYDADNILDQIATEGLRQKVDSERGNHHKLKAFISQRNPLLFRNKIARKVQDVRQRLDVVLEEGSKLGLTSMAIMDNQNGDALDDRKTSSLVNESEIYGRDEEKKVVVETLLNYMSNIDYLSVYAICGMGGIGKTTLAQLVYNDERVDNHFELRIWVCVSVDFSLPRCERLPPLGKLPSLTYLELWHMDSVKRLDGEWHGMNNGESSSFPALKWLFIKEMPNLEEWKIPDTIESFPCLETLYVEECPKLKELPFLANLKTLYLKKVHTAVVRSVMFLTSLTELHLYRFSELDVLLEGLRNDKAEIVQPLSNLKTLQIWNCEGLCSLPNWLGSLQSLSKMEIWNCPDLNSLPDDLQNLKSLKRLVINDCPVLLKKRCEKPNGEDWPKISHIPEIIIY